MVTSGVWELDIYPHLPIKYNPKDVLFTYFIEFDNINPIISNNKNVQDISRLIFDSLFTYN